MTDTEMIDELGWWCFELGFKTIEEFKDDLMWTKTSIRLQALRLIIHGWNLAQYRGAEATHVLKELESKNLLT